jgi:hypothetical protein
MATPAVAVKQLLAALGVSGNLADVGFLGRVAIWRGGSFFGRWSLLCRSRLSGGLRGALLRLRLLRGNYEWANGEKCDSQLRDFH